MHVHYYAMLLSMWRGGAGAADMGWKGDRAFCFASTRSPRRSTPLLPVLLCAPLP